MKLTDAQIDALLYGGMMRVSISYSRFQRNRKSIRILPEAAENSV